jgi:hypothetical protein
MQSGPKNISNLQPMKLLGFKTGQTCEEGRKNSVSSLPSETSGLPEQRCTVNSIQYIHNSEQHYRGGGVHSSVPAEHIHVHMCIDLA